MLGSTLALCNVDRVVMSVAIVPLSQARGGSQSFAGIVWLFSAVIFPLGLYRVAHNLRSSSGLLRWQDGHGTGATFFWSMNMLLTPWDAESSLWALLAMRFLLRLRKSGAAW